MAKQSSELSVLKFLKMKEAGEKIAVVTVYDYPTARIADAAGVDILLVGDSVASVVQGRSTTLGVTLEETIYHTEMVARAAERAFVVADLPFPYCQLVPEEAVRASARILKETTASAVKIEGGAKRASTVRALVDAGIPVLGHVGLFPQSVKALGGWRVQRDYDQLLADALAVQEAGAFAIVIECVPRDDAASVTQKLRAPTIGIGAGNGCDGQVVVFHDLFNFALQEPDALPKHARLYRDLHRIIDEGLREYVSDVKSGAFPSDAESFGVKKA